MVQIQTEHIVIAAVTAYLMVAVGVWAYGRGLSEASQRGRAEGLWAFSDLDTEGARAQLLALVWPVIPLGSAIRALGQAWRYSLWTLPRVPAQALGRLRLGRTKTQNKAQDKAKAKGGGRDA